MIQFGIVPYLKELTLKELEDLPFSFRFDESKTSKIKKQYDAYATYQSNLFLAFCLDILKLFFVGKCTADLLHQLHEVMEKLKLNVESILSLVMDGPSVNLLFKLKLEKELEKKNKQLIEVGTCPLHTVSIAFPEGLKTLIGETEIDLDQFVLDLFVSFKYSTKRINNYFDDEFLKEV